MKKELYWLVESNGDLSATIKNLSDAEIIIKGDFSSQCEDDEFEIDDLQYTITPVALTEEEFNNLPEV